MASSQSPDAPGGFSTGWDSYWDHAPSGAAHKEGGPLHQVLDRFWSKLFERVFAAMDRSPAVLDLACGAGAVSRNALAASARSGRACTAEVFAVDTAPAAVTRLRLRHPGVHCAIADAAVLPFQGASFDFVGSQFGFEYAGPDAVTEVARLVSPGGVMAAVMHMKNGGIFNECTGNLKAIDDFRKCNILGLFERLYNAALEFRQQRADEARFRQCDREFAAAVAAAEKVLAQWGKGIANGVLFGLYGDIGHMYRRLSAYEADDVFVWTQRMAREMDSYSDRMNAMLRSAIDAAELDLLLGQLRELGFSLRFYDTLRVDERGAPCGWLVVAGKPGVAGTAAITG